jgi:hypothetical protein
MQAVDKIVQGIKSTHPTEEGRKEDRELRRLEIANEKTRLELERDRLAAELLRAGEERLLRSEQARRWDLLLSKLVSK